MYKYIKNENDLFTLMLKLIYNKSLKHGFYNVDDYENKISNSVLYAAFKTINKTDNRLNISNNLYNIYCITGIYYDKYYIFNTKKIYHKVNSYSINLIKDKNIYDLSKEINPELYLKDVFDIYNGKINKNCCIIFPYNNNIFCLSKSFNNIYYRKNDKGKLCLYVNNECWEY